MTSPTIDESVMIEALKASSPDQIGESARRLHAGAQLLLLDAYDRKVTRDQFIAAIGAACYLADALGRHEMITAVKRFESEHGVVTKADIEVVIASVVTMVQQHSEQCSKMADLIVQCPKDEDKVH